MTLLSSSTRITALHDRGNAAWHRLPPATSAAPDPLAASPAALAAAVTAAGVDDDPFLSLVAAQHLANFRLWHVEDLARIPSALDSEIAGAKRAIDRINQQRNDLAEQIDGALLASLESQSDTAHLHSETPGMMIDRLSILSLKLHHTIEEVSRPDAPSGHAQRNQERMHILQAQRADLAACLDLLWEDVTAGRRRFKIYRQLKMYNDPTLNPSLYGQRNFKEAATPPSAVLPAAEK